MSSQEDYIRQIQATSALNALGVSGVRGRIPSGTTDVVMSRLFPERRAEIDTSEERRQAVYDYLDIYGALPDHYRENPGEFDCRIKWNGFIPHGPQEKQHAFLWLPNRHAMYGGQAGGGKSDALLMAALQYVDVPGYAALLVRQSYPDLSQPGAIMSRAKEWLKPTSARWNENQREFTFPSGAKLAFGYIRRDDDVYQYQSAEFQFIGVDELTQFTEFQYQYMESRLRRLEGFPVPLRMRAATNPGGKGHQWVRRKFVEKNKDPDFGFVPASLEDNQYLDRGEYRTSLEHLDPYTRAQLLHGDWTARPPGSWAFDHTHLDAVFKIGEQWDKAWREGQMPPPFENYLMAGMDYGEASHALLVYPLEMHSAWVPREHVYSHGEPDREAYKFLEIVDKYGYPLKRSRFDASKPESMRLFYRTLRQERGPEFGRPSPIAFNKFKRAAILHVRGMASRAAWGETKGVLGISPTGCPIFQSQIYDLKFKGEDTEDLVKEEDHGPDALFSWAAPEIKRWSIPDPKPPGAPVAGTASSSLSAG